MAKISYTNTSLRYQAIKREYESYQEAIFHYGIFFDGYYTELLAEKLKELTGYQYCLPCVNGTAALYTLFDYYSKWFTKAIVTPLTFRATHNALKRARIDFLYCPVDKYLLGVINASSDLLCVPVGLLGRQPSYNPENVVIEDACQNWITSTTLVDKAISFDPTKNIASCGNGGAVLTNDKSVYQHAKRLICHDSEVSGLNLRMSELEAAYVLAQLPYLQAWQERRLSIVKRYLEAYPNELYENTSLENHDLQKYAIILDDLPQDAPFSFKNLYPEEFRRLYFKKYLVGIPLYPELTENDIVTICDYLKQLKRPQYLHAA